ncbi:MAG: flippase-like domain-containing protein, partial [Nitrospinae bacterium]|nr:flippase-like domain-containing protein [Nitrospinota bacterium]
MKDNIFCFFKFFLATGLIYWLIETDKLSLIKLQGALQSLDKLLVGGLLVWFIVFLSAVRWYLLLKSQQITIPFKDTLKLNMISLFFSTFVPGAISGDVAKAYYITHKEKSRKTAAMVTVGVDRLIGLMALFLVLLFSAIFEWEKVKNIPEISFFIYSIVVTA